MCSETLFMYKKWSKHNDKAFQNRQIDQIDW